jgi:hypothetical protein
MLGRFQPRAAATQLEDVITLVAGPREAEWFRERGREFRNAVAHGHEQSPTPEKDVSHLVQVVRYLLKSLLEYLVDGPQRSIADYAKHIKARVRSHGYGPTCRSAEQGSAQLHFQVASRNSDQSRR